MKELKKAFNKEMLAKLIYEFLKETGADVDCLYCKTNSWRVVSDLTALPMSLNKTKLSFVLLICKNCGFTRFHSTEVFYEWLQKHPDPPGDNDS